MKDYGIALEIIQRMIKGLETKTDIEMLIKLELYNLMKKRPKIISCQSLNIKRDFIQ